MKIIHPDGTIIEFRDVVEYHQHLALQRQQALAAELLHPVEHAAVAAAEDDEDEAELVQDEAEDEPLVLVRANSSHRHPDSIYITEAVKPTFDVLRRYPAGLTSKRIAEILGVTHSTASSAVYRLRQPIPLVERMRGGRFRLTAMGERVRIRTAVRTLRLNVNLGWGPWMAERQELPE